MTSTNPNQQIRTEVRNGLNEVVSVTDAGASTLCYAYDSGSRLLAVAKSTGGDCRAEVFNSASTVIGYDLLGRKTSVDDDDAGSWTFKYNALGEQIEATSLRGTCTRTRFDLRGRAHSRVDYSNASCTAAVQTAGWTFDTLVKGALSSETNSATWPSLPTNYFARNYGYDGFGRPNLVTTTIDSTSTYSESTTYDEYGRIFQQFDASGQGILSQYQRGYLRRLREAAPGLVGEIYYEVRALDARGQVLEDWRGVRVDFSGDEAVAGLVSKRSYRPDTGWLTGIESTDRPAAGGRRLQHWTVGHDSIGNVLFREDAQRSTVYREAAQYDNLNRLTVLDRYQNGALTQTSNYGYDAWGNLIGKQGFSNVAYNAQGTGCTSTSGPHAIASAQVVNVDGYNVGPLSFCYDANGNMTSMRRGEVEERSIRYTPAEQVREIASVSANQTIRFDYGPDRKRYQRREYNPSAVLLRTVRYLGNVEVIDVNPGLGVPEVKRYIGGALVITLRSDGGGSKAYLYTDPQGSTDLVTDRFGNVGTICKPGQPDVCRQIGQRQGFDAFGLRRRVETTPVWQVLPWADRQSFDSRATSRGYTGHESVDPVGLVHMNGRMYDPLIGRFIQPDPIVQDPYNTQSHNRYSYVLNNPLSAVDPSGNLSVRQAVLTVAAIVVTYYTGVWAIGYLGKGAVGSAAMTAAAGGFVAGGLTTGTLKGALAGSFGSLATMGVGAAFTGAGQVLAQGVVGGVMSELQGGKFGHGFASAGMSAALNPAIAQGVQGGAGQLVAHAVLGGTASVVAGGKFANGAVTAAFSYAFGSAARGREESGPRRPDDYTDAQLEAYVYESPQVAFNLSPPPQWLLDGVTGFGDGVYSAVTFGFGDLSDVRSQLDVGGAVRKDSTIYRASYLAGNIEGGAAVGGAVLRGAAWIGGTRIGHILNHNRYVRVGPGRMPRNGTLPAGPNVPRVSIGSGPGNPHLDLRVRPFD